MSKLITFLEEALKKADISVSAAAKRSGSDSGFFYRVFRGQVAPSDSFLKACAYVLNEQGVTYEYLAALRALDNHDNKTIRGV